MKNPSGQDVLRTMLAADPRYREGAYEFVRDSLDHTLKKVTSKQEPHRHVTGQELLEGFRDLALKEFGPLALRVLHYWGVKESVDVGHLVFNMVHFKLLGKSDSDSIEDFRDGFDFQEAFVTPFLPDPEPAASAPEAETPVTPPPRAKPRRRRAPKKKSSE